MNWIKTNDYKTEKHVPFIEIIDKKDNLITINASIGKEIAHPNTVEHHIDWLELYFVEDNGNAIMLGRYEFSSHNDILSQPEITVKIKTDKKGEIRALSYCNIHGLWTNSIAL